METQISKTVNLDGKVIKILDEYTVVINLGEKDANVGDILNIYEVASEVIDPDTNEVLGTIDLPKAEIKVKEVFQKFSICYTNEKTTTNIFSSLLDLQGGATTTYHPLNVNTEQNENLLVKDLVISIGDPVKIIEKVSSSS